MDPSSKAERETASTAELRMRFTSRHGTPKPRSFRGSQKPCLVLKFLIPAAKYQSILKEYYQKPFFRINNPPQSAEARKRKASFSSQTLHRESFG